MALEGEWSLPRHSECGHLCSCEYVCNKLGRRVQCFTYTRVVGLSLEANWLPQTYLKLGFVRVLCLFRLTSTVLGLRSHNPDYSQRKQGSYGPLYQRYQRAEGTAHCRTTLIRGACALCLPHALRRRTPRFCRGDKSPMTRLLDVYCNWRHLSLPPPWALFSSSQGSNIWLH